VLSPRLKQPLFVVLLTLAVAAVVSLVGTFLHHSVDQWFVHAWARAFWIGAAAGVPSALLVAGPLRKIADWVCK
jgi:hypothetical protein